MGDTRAAGGQTSLRNTVVNPTGLDAPGHWPSAGERLSRAYGTPRYTKSAKTTAVQAYPCLLAEGEAFTSLCQHISDAISHQFSR